MSHSIRLDLAALPRLVTTCDLAIAVDGARIWPVRGAADPGLRIQIDDLLVHLTDFWKPLMLRQVYPIDLPSTPILPSRLRQAAEQRWEGLPEETVAQEEDAVADFEEAHDLARAFAGHFGLPSLWIMRRGGAFTVESEREVFRLPADTVRQELSRVGDWIVDRLLGDDRDRWSRSASAWAARGDDDDAGLLAWSAGLSRNVASGLVDDGTLRAPRTFDDAMADDDELRIAARMAGALSASQIRSIVGLARGFERRDAPDLATLADACATELEARQWTAQPFEQGEVAALVVRERLALNTGHAVDMNGLLRRLGIDVRCRAAEPDMLDGLAIWGPLHGPGVLLNVASRRMHGASHLHDDPASGEAARVTLAHELCHLLLDGRHAVSAVDVLRARMPAGVEQRAKSFAGELLLPKRLAAQYWDAALRPDDAGAVEALLNQLSSVFGVTRSVASWKLEHAARHEDVDLRAVLDHLVPSR